MKVTPTILPLMLIADVSVGVSYMYVAALIVVLFYGNYEVLRWHLMPTIIFFEYLLVAV